MRVLVCGGRDFDDIALVYECLTELRPSVVIHGGCPTGADFFADSWARANAEISVFYADWTRHGKAAGPLRNQRMIDEGKPDAVLAFDGGRGTADMVRRARAAGLQIIDPCSAHNTAL
jgi:hypothetical protein